MEPVQASGTRVRSGSIVGSAAPMRTTQVSPTARAVPPTPTVKTPRSPPPLTPGGSGFLSPQTPVSRAAAWLQLNMPVVWAALAALPALQLPHRRRRIFSARTLVMLCLLLGVLLLAWVGERAREGRWRSEVDRRASEWKEFLRTVPPFSPHLFPTRRGIVYTASGEDLPLCIVSIIMLRTLGCSLPIEIVHFRGEIGERERGWVSRIPGGAVALREVESMVGEIGKRYWESVAMNATTATQLGAEPGDASPENGMPRSGMGPTGPIWYPHLPIKWDKNPGHPKQPERNPQLKAAAVLFSSFQEVLYMDSDTFPVMDPSFLFEHAAFTEGMVEVDAPGGQRIEVPVSAIFWPDYRAIDPNNPVFRTFGLPMRSVARREKSQDSGQLLVSKSRAWRALNLALYMASDSSLPLRGGRPYYYLLLQGDKDTFRFAWRATGTGFFGVGYDNRAYVQPAGDLFYEVEHDWWSSLWRSRGANMTFATRDGDLAVVPEFAKDFCGHTMVQAHPSAPAIPLFYHSSGVKLHATGAQNSLAALSARLHPSGRRWTYYQRYLYRDPRTGLASYVIPREILKHTRDKDTNWLRGFPSWNCRVLEPVPEVGLEVETVLIDDKTGGVNDIWRKGVQGMLEVCGGEEEIGIVGKGRPKKEKVDEPKGVRTRRWGWNRWMFGDGI